MVVLYCISHIDLTKCAGKDSFACGGSTQDQGLGPPVLMDGLTNPMPEILKTVQGLPGPCLRYLLSLPQPLRFFCSLALLHVWLFVRPWQAELAGCLVIPCEDGIARSCLVYALGN